MNVGSSSTLARRLIGYFNGTHKNTGKLIPLIKSEGIGAFKLQVIPLIEFYSVNQELSLEQYFLLHPEYNLNVLKVVSDFSGAKQIWGVRKRGIERSLIYIRYSIFFVFFYELYILSYI